MNEQTFLVYNDHHHVDQVTNMDGLTLNAQVNKISHVYHLNGDIDPYINIYPPLTLPDGEELSQFPLRAVDIAEGVSCPIERGSIISVYIPVNGGKPVITSVTDQNLTLDGDYSKCPVCGEPLHPTTSSLSIGRCLNRACPAQLSYNILNFLSCIGMPINTATCNVIKYSLCRGLIHTLDKLFWLTLEDLIFPYLSIEDIQWFLYELHALRGEVDLGQLIRGIRIPDWTEQDYNLFDDLVERNQLLLTDWPVLMEDAIHAQSPELNWGALKRFFQSPANTELLINLTSILSG